MKVSQLSGLLVDPASLVQDGEAVMDRDAHLQEGIHVGLRQGIVGRQVDEGLVHPLMADPFKDVLAPSVDGDPPDLPDVRR